MSSEHVSLLKQFVQMCKKNPAILHKPEFAFYKEYLESLGAKLPSDSASSASSFSEEFKGTDETKGNAKFEEEQHEDEPEEMEPAPDLDNSGVVEDQTAAADMALAMGDPDKEVGEEDMDKANEHRDAAMASFNEGDYAKALHHFTQAIELNPGSAMLHAKRANTLLKMNKLKAAILDCDKAISINPDSAQPYKFRGRAHRLLGNWMEAHSDLAMSCKLDYDETAYEWLKEVEPNAKKLQEYERSKQRHAEEKELRQRRERIRRAQEANRAAAEKQAEENFELDGDDAGAFGELLKDPEFLKAIKDDPTLVQKLMEIMQNPANMMKHMGDPNIQKLLSKLGSKMGAGPKEPFGSGSHTTFTDAVFSTTEETPTAGDGPKPPKKAPEPDLD